jgi:hypothetical protein
MAENQLESSQAGEEVELPTPSFSSTGDSSTSTGADEIVSKLLPQLEQIIERKVQSTKDKRISEIEKVLGGRSKILAELESEGVNIPKEVRTQMQIRELEERLAGQTAQPAPVRDDGSSQTKAAVSEAIAELKENGLTTDDPAFIEILRGKYASREAFDLKVQKYVNQKLRPPKPANPADVVQSPARGGATEKSVEALTNEYISKMRAAPRGPSGEATRRAIKNEYIQKGVDIHGVDFT